MTDYNSIQEALTAYDLDFDIELVPTFVRNIVDELGNDIEIPFKKGVVRKDNGYPLGVVGDKYTIAPLKTVLNALQPLIDDGSISVSRFYVENFGARVMCCFKINNCYTDHGGFLTDTEFNLKLSHDGTSKGIVSFLARNIDGKIYPFGDEYSLSFKHTKGSVVKINKLETILTAARDQWKDFQEHVQLGSVEPVSREEALEYLKSYVNITNETKQGENALEAIFKRWNNAIIPSMRGTIFGLFISVCEWAQEEKSVRLTKKRKAQTDGEINLEEVRAMNMLKNPQIYKAWAGVKVFTNVKFSLR